MLDDGARYVYGEGLVSQTSGANTYYYLADGLGSTMKTVDATGAVVNGYTYDIYGKKTSSTGSQPNEFDFAGQQTDPTGLQYLRARYSDPETGGFVSRDPLSATPGWPGNPLGYVGGNPASRVDPSGAVVHRSCVYRPRWRLCWGA
ncbi:MAG: RHS repeat-associated core domain-containing protein [Tepidiformaceae bacterium]